MFFHSIKNSFFLKKKKIKPSHKQSPQQQLLVFEQQNSQLKQRLEKGIIQNHMMMLIGRTIDSLILIEQMHKTCCKIYDNTHPFVTDYLIKQITQHNQQLIAELDDFIDKVNFQQILNASPEDYLNLWITNSHSPASILTSIWVRYVQSQIKEADQVQMFLNEEIYLFTTIILSIFNKIHPTPNNKKTQYKLRFAFLNKLSEEEMFKNIMVIFIARFDKDKGLEGQFTKKQIQQTVNQLQNLINFKSIETPFQQSIDMMLSFSRESRLKLKIQSLVCVIQNIKKEIKQYRQQFGLKALELGTDQILPVVNFVCQKTKQNILAAINYISAFLDHIKIDKERLLNQISEDSFYCTQLVQAASSIYCHASQFML